MHKDIRTMSVDESCTREKVTLLLIFAIGNSTNHKS